MQTLQQWSRQSSAEGDLRLFMPFISIRAILMTFLIKTLNKTEAHSMALIFSNKPFIIYTTILAKGFSAMKRLYISFIPSNIA